MIRAGMGFGLAPFEEYPCMRAWTGGESTST
jgi:hypothetical protein